MSINESSVINLKRAEYQLYQAGQVQGYAQGVKQAKLVVEAARKQIAEQYEKVSGSKLSKKALKQQQDAAAQWLQVFDQITSHLEKEIQQKGEEGNTKWIEALESRKPVENKTLRQRATAGLAAVLKP